MQYEYKIIKESDSLVGNLVYCLFLHFFIPYYNDTYLNTANLFNVERLYCSLITWQANGFCEKDRYKMSTIDEYCTYSETVSPEF